jgi:hypothetical protein
MAPGPNVCMTQQTNDEPNIDNYPDEFEDIDVELVRLVLVSRDSLAGRVDFPHRKPMRQQFLACESPCKR